ncbi:hypothetical protein DERP_002863 [Dermatophagoides pteronyssinus]|uniref:Uncharacterized protein n=1 Tax=Dermatophagoides pteronyssinus TaxID=6956 RepID=A0ABQ8JVX8_DERPT|nr:hypothetical protein DERP_002863 [Dermatophagoides pteronyssinus]
MITYHSRGISISEAIDNNMNLSLIVYASESLKCWYLSTIDTFITITRSNNPHSILLRKVSINL